MSIVHCHHCNKDIDTDFDAVHFDDEENCVLELEKKERKRDIKFPLYLQNHVFSHRLLSETACQTVQRKTEGMSEFGITMSDFGPNILHHVYEDYLMAEYDVITEQQFAFAKLNVSNAMTRKIAEHKQKTVIG